MNLEVLLIPDCPHAAGALARMREVVEALTPGSPIHKVQVDTQAAALDLGFTGSPTLRVEGRDVEPSDHAPTLACRLYANGEGMPDRWRIEAAMLRELRPRHILFMCVANSARSQLAEGIARSLAPESVKISSAGSQPSVVRPQAISVLEESGIDISHHRSKSVQAVATNSVDAVITLCAEEVCPVFLGKAWRLHWGLPDPAAATGDEKRILDAFRTTRDELHRRLSVLFEGWKP